MNLAKKLRNGDVISAWSYDACIYTGISVGVHDRMIGKSKAIISVESVDTADGLIKRIHINKAEAEKYGFKISIF